MSKVLVSASAQLSQLLFTMPRTRYVDVPESDTEIIEEEITQRKTSRGVSIKKVRTPMTQSLPTTAKKASGSQSKLRRNCWGHKQ